MTDCFRFNLVANVLLLASNSCAHTHTRHQADPSLCCATDPCSQTVAQGKNSLADPIIAQTRRKQVLYSQTIACSSLHWCWRCVAERGIVRIDRCLWTLTLVALLLIEVIFAIFAVVALLPHIALCRVALLYRSLVLCDLCRHLVRYGILFCSLLELRTGWYTEELHCLLLLR
jgi:hypothetical protein